MKFAAIVSYLFFLALPSEFALAKTFDCDVTRFDLIDLPKGTATLKNHVGNFVLDTKVPYKSIVTKLVDYPNEAGMLFCYTSGGANPGLRCAAAKWNPKTDQGLTEAAQEALMNQDADTTLLNYSVTRAYLFIGAMSVSSAANDASFVTRYDERSAYTTSCKAQER